MARRHRIWFPGASYHITARGNRKFFIFYDDKDHQQYLSILKETQEQLPYYLHSYCLMSNHIHLLLETQNIPITEIMKTIQTHYAVYFNKRYDLVGHVFQGRFKSDLIKDASHFLNTSRYIHTNPLEAEITSEIQDYPWSSYPAYFTSTPNPLVTTEKTLSFFQAPQKENYLKFLLSPKPKE
ncbi:transposase [Neobacillus sp. D3-1R]|uniref:transposase n=1 Tax=Neobacillus sp. D3-1R TaxID=3445778 RepID=UPI003F9FE650